MSKQLVISAIIVVSASVAIAAELPLIVSEVVTGPSSHVRLTNASHRTITAWSLASTVTTGDRTHREVLTTDGYLSEVTHGLPGAAQRLERLSADESREVPLDPLPDGAKVEAIAVVYDDATAAGDETVIAQIFAHRAQERDALGAVVQNFTDVLGAKKGAAALTDLQERFTVLAAKDNSVPCRAALDAVQNYSRKGNDEAITQSLQTYAAFVTKEYELAKRNATRKQA
jgi:hypothetical protein